MNQMFRAPGQPVTKVDDIVSEGRGDWDGRVKRAIASETSWKRVVFALIVPLSVSVSGNVYQAASKPPPTVVHVVHNSIGGVIAVTANSDGSDAPSQIELKAAVQEWITNCRTVYVDINAMRRSLTSCAYLIDKGSQADMDMARFYNTPHKEEPFYRAAIETVALKNVVAIPPTANDVGPNQMQTWSVTWQEIVTSRDGSYETAKPWGANVTFIYRRPNDTTEAQLDPNGIHVTSYSWTEK